MKRKILFLGDLNNNTGPANVNKGLYDKLKDEMIYTEKKSKIGNLFLILRYYLCVDAIVISGVSSMIRIVLLLYGFKKKKIVYLSHGCIKYENEFTNNKNLSFQKLEDKVLMKSSLVLCVSNKLLSILQASYPVIKSKVKVLYNGVEWDKNDVKSSGEQAHIIVTAGGGRKQKRNYELGKAIEYYNKKFGDKVFLFVTGRWGDQSESMSSLQHTIHLGQLDSPAYQKLLNHSLLFIQNSEFEPFGLAPIDALKNGCSILLSVNVGMLEIIDDFPEDYLIKDFSDIVEIADKIHGILSKGGNNKELCKKIDFEYCSVEFRAKQLMYYIGELNGKA